MLRSVWLCWPSLLLVLQQAAASTTEDATNADSLAHARWVKGNAVWGDFECPDLGSHPGKTIDECKAVCRLVHGCSAFNYQDSTKSCDLRRCRRIVGVVIPAVMVKNGWVGYALQDPKDAIARDRQAITGSTLGKTITKDIAKVNKSMHHDFNSMKTFAGKISGAMKDIREGKKIPKGYWKPTFNSSSTEDTQTSSSPSQSTTSTTLQTTATLQTTEVGGIEHLGDGWRGMVDPATGRKYYWNIENAAGSRTWQKPEPNTTPKPVPAADQTGTSTTVAAVSTSAAPVLHAFASGMPQAVDDAIGKIPSVCRAFPVNTKSGCPDLGGGGSFSLAACVEEMNKLKGDTINFKNGFCQIRSCGSAALQYVPADQQLCDGEGQFCRVEVYSMFCQGSKLQLESKFGEFGSEETDAARQKFLVPAWVPNMLWLSVPFLIGMVVVYRRKTAHARTRMISSRSGQDDESQSDADAGSDMEALLGVE